MDEKALKIIDSSTLLSMAPKKRLDYIINYPKPLALVRSLLPQDLLITFREVGVEDCLEVIELMSTEQVQGILDLEIWDKDRIDTKKAGAYLCLLYEANPERALKQIYDLDIEFLGLMIKTSSTIYDTTLNEEPEEYSDLTLTSPDGRFIVCFKTDKDILPLSRALGCMLEQLFAKDVELALLMLERVRFELASGLEEASLHFRNARLSEMGILPTEERLELMAPLRSDQLKKVSSVGVLDDAQRSVHTLMPVKKEQQHSFLRASLATISKEAQSRFDLSFQHVAVNLHASLDGDFSDRDALKNTSHYTETLIEYGLLQVTKGDQVMAKDALEQYRLLDIVRVGRTALLTLRKNVLALLKSPIYLVGPNFALVDSPLREVAVSLCQKEPLYFEGLLQPNLLTNRYFENVIELDATTKAVHELKFRALLCGAKGLEYHLSQSKESPVLSHSSIFTEYLINTFFGNEKFAKLSQKSIDGILNNKQLIPEFVAHCRKTGQELSHLLSDGMLNFDERMAQYVNVILGQLERDPYCLLSQ